MQKQSLTLVSSSLFLYIDFSSSSCSHPMSKELTCSAPLTADHMALQPLLTAGLSPSLAVLKARSSGTCPCPWQGGRNEVICKFPSNPNLFVSAVGEIALQSHTLHSCIRVNAYYWKRAAEGISSLSIHLQQQQFGGWRCSEHSRVHGWVATPGDSTAGSRAQALLVSQ